MKLLIFTLHVCMGICQNLSFSSFLQKMLTLKQPITTAYSPSPFNKSQNSFTMRLACPPYSANSKEICKKINRSAVSHEKIATDGTVSKCTASIDIFPLKMQSKQTKRKPPFHEQLMKNESIELFSPNVGLKVRRLKRNTHKFHKNFKTDEILHFFASSLSKPLKVKSSRTFQIRNLDRSKYRKREIIEDKPIVKWEEDQFQAPQEVTAHVIPPPFSSNLSGWRAESSDQTNIGTTAQQECLQDPMRNVQRMPSINIGMDNSFRPTEQDQIEKTADGQYSQNEPNYPSESYNLPQESLKLVPHSESSCYMSPISIKIKEESQSEVPFKQLSQNTVSHQAISSKGSKPILVSKLSLKDIFNFSQKEETQYKQAQKMEENNENQAFNLGQCILNSESVGFSYKEDNHSYQRADESDGIRLTEREMNSCGYSLMKILQSQSNVKADHQTERKGSVMAQKIEQFGENCKQFFTNVAAVLNPFKKQSQMDPIDEECTVKQCQEESLMDSVPILHTLHSKVCSHKYEKQQAKDYHISIREATMQITQGWCNQNDAITQREGTNHEMKMPSQSYMTEMRINLMAKDINNQSFYSEVSLDIDQQSINQMESHSPQYVKELQQVETVDYLMKLAENISEQMTTWRRDKDISEMVDAQIDHLQEEILEKLY